MSARSLLAVFMLAGLALQTAPAGAGGPLLVEIPLDVDVYDQPGGEGKPRGVCQVAARSISSSEMVINGARLRAPRTRCLAARVGFGAARGKTDRTTP